MSEWGGLDTLHILAGVPSTSTLTQLTGMELAPVTSAASTRKNPAQRFTFTSTDTNVADSASPGVDGLDKLAEEARACSEVNYVGTVLALGAFVSSAFLRRDELELDYGYLS
jgi:hypothetical protein